MRAERDSRHLREGRAKFWRIFVVSSFFAVVLGANLFVGAVMIAKNFRASQSTESKRLSRVTRPLLDGTFCSYSVFDSNTAEAVENKVARCDGSDDRKSRLESRSTFNWGGK